MTAPNVLDVIIIGAGGAGLLCAMTAGQRGRSVAVLEHNERVGKKIANPKSLIESIKFFNYIN